jgi:hypothetical protein
LQIGWTVFFLGVGINLLKYEPGEICENERHPFSMFLLLIHQSSLRKCKLNITKCR